MLIIDPNKKAYIRDVLDLIKERIPDPETITAYVIGENGGYQGYWREYDAPPYDGRPYSIDIIKTKSVPLKKVVSLLLDHLDVELHTIEVNGKSTVWLGDKYDPEN